MFVSRLEASDIHILLKLVRACVGPWGSGLGSHGAPLLCARLPCLDCPPPLLALPLPGVWMDGAIGARQKIPDDDEDEEWRKGDDGSPRMPWSPPPA